MKQFIYILLGLVLSVSGYSANFTPMKAGIPVVEDGEMLKYSDYISGEKTAELYLVYKKESLSGWGDVIKVYEFINSMNKPRKLPLKLSEFEGYYIVSLKNASLVEEYRNFSNRITSDNLKGPYQHFYQMNADQKQIDYSQKIWDGYESRDTKSRIKIKPDYPVWDGNSIAFLGSRYLDLSSEGMAYLVEPSILKDPIPFTVKIFAHETVTTPVLGKFPAKKYGALISDPFIGKLINSMMSETFMWVEDSPRKLVVKTQNYTGETLYLESISTF